MYTQVQLLYYLWKTIIPTSLLNIFYFFISVKMDNYGNQKSKDPKSPSYITSSFPAVYKKICTNEQQQNVSINEIVTVKELNRKLIQILL